MELKEKFEKVFSSGHSFKIENVVKRIDGEWESRIVWAHQQLPGRQIIKECEWLGFEKIEDCVDDILVYLQKNS